MRLYRITICAPSFIMLLFNLTNSNYSTNKSQYVPYVTTEDSYYSENGDNYFTANSNNNGNSEYNYNDYDNDHTLPDLLFPDSTNSPPDNNGITWMPLPGSSEEDRGEDGETEERFDNKWNTVDDVSSDADGGTTGSGIVEGAPAPGPSGGGHGPSANDEEEPVQPKKAASGTMVLVIGIILGAFVGMMLIVIIVLKMRTGVPGNGGMKCEETAVAGAGMRSGAGQVYLDGHSSAPRYQFAPPNDYGELGVTGGGNCESERETATTSLMEGGGPRGPGRGPSGNGFFNTNCSNLAAAAQAAAHNGGDRSRLFRKSNGSKPVREWYV